jgi:hypothetical protein
MSKFYEPISIAIGVFIVAWAGYGIYESTVASPPYTILSKTKLYQIRRYDALTVVVHTKNSDSFQSLFRYISGNNATQKKIPMTAPVIEKDSTMMFVLPTNMTSPPLPNNPNLQIREFKNVTVGVASFRGSINKTQKIKAQLITTLQNDNVLVSDEWMLCQYNSPWVIPFLRKNEVWIIVPDPQEPTPSR